jgi:hypothetical protein
MDSAWLQAILPGHGLRSQLLAYIGFTTTRFDRSSPRASMDFRALHLNDAEALAEAVPVQIPGSGSDGDDPFRHLAPFDCNRR